MREKWCEKKQYGPADEGTTMTTIVDAALHSSPHLHMTREGETYYASKLPPLRVLGTLHVVDGRPLVQGRLGDRGPVRATRAFSWTSRLTCPGQMRRDARHPS